MNWFLPLGDFAPVAIPLLVLALAWAVILREQRRRRLAAAATKASTASAGEAGAGGRVRQPLPLSREVFDFFRATGPGWQARIDEVLKRYVRDEEERAHRRTVKIEETKSRVAEERSDYEGGEDPAGEEGQER